MLGIGFGELVVIAFVAFLAIGPKNLPIFMRKFAIFYRQIMGLRDDLKYKIMSIDHEEIAEKIVKQDNKDA